MGSKVSEIFLNFRRKYNTVLNFTLYNGVGKLLFFYIRGAYFSKLLHHNTS